jgi:hypothetical protein
MGTRATHALGLLRGLFWFGYFLVRVVIALALGALLGWGLVASPYALHLHGAIVFAIGVGVVACYIAMPFTLADVQLHWGVVELLRAPIIALFVAAAVLARLGLEKLQPGNIRHLEFLSAQPALWRVPGALVAGMITSWVASAFVLGPAPASGGPIPGIDKKVYRGGTRIHYDQWFKRMSTMAKGKLSLVWGFAPVVLHPLAKMGLLLFGAIGSGKTIVLSILLKSFLPHVARKDGFCRAVVLDVANHYRGLLASLYPDLRAINAHLLHALDSSSECWDMAADLVNQSAIEFAKALFPSRRGGDAAFWDGAVQMVCAACVNGMRAKFGEEWTFWMLLIRMSSLELIRETVLWDPDNLTNRQVLEQFLDSADRRLPANIAAALAERCGAFHEIARSMHEQHRRGQRFSIRKWANESSVAVFGWTAESEAQMQALFAAFFAVMRRVLLGQSESSERFTLILGDEIGAVPVGPDYETLVRLGRSRGVIAVAAMHSVASARNSFGVQASNAVLANFGWVGCLRVDAETAQYVSDRFGKSEVERQEPPQAGESVGRTKIVETPLVSPGELVAQWAIDFHAGRGPHAFFNTDQGDAFAVHYPPENLRRDLPLFPPFSPRPFDDDELGDCPIPARPSPKPRGTGEKKKPRSLEERLNDLG